MRGVPGVVWTPAPPPAMTRALERAELALATTARATQSPAPSAAAVMSFGESRAWTCAPMPVATGVGSSVAARGAAGRSAERPDHDGTGAASSSGRDDASGAARGEDARGSSPPRGEGAYPSGVPDRPPFLRGIAREGARGGSARAGNRILGTNLRPRTVDVKSR